LINRAHPDGSDSFPLVFVIVSTFFSIIYFFPPLEIWGKNRIRATPESTIAGAREINYPLMKDYGDYFF